MNEATQAMKEALAAIEYERIRQDRKWGRQRHGFPVWLTVLSEEVGEVARAMLELRATPVDNAGGRDFALAHLERELRQVGAVAAAFLEHVSEARQAGDGMPTEVWQ